MQFFGTDLRFLLLKSKYSKQKLIIIILMNRKFYLLVAILNCFLHINTSAQSGVNSPYYHRSIKPEQFSAPTSPTGILGYSNTGNNMDVVYHRCDWTINPNAAKNISGTVTTYFKTTAANVNIITFDLNKTSFNNASLVVRYHGTVCTKSFPASGKVDTLSITLPVTIAAAGTLDSVSITYSGAPPAQYGGATTGFQIGGSGANLYTSTLSESYEDKDWWPCKADMLDKIDSMNINVTVPWNPGSVNVDTFWVATNGVLYDSTITGLNRTFKFKTRYPIASYLVAVSVGKFSRYYRSVNVSGTNTQVAYYILRNTAGHAALVTAMDKINPVLQAFNTRFGDYPFKLEKHGFYGGLIGATGMEHQTFSAMQSSALSNLGVLTHELMHQWFGDAVSFGTWNDLWLAEGPARYSEILAAQLFPAAGFTAASTLQTNLKTNALGLTTTETWIPNANIANSETIWSTSYGSSVYERGAMVISMLRVLLGDTKFYEAMTNYQTALKGKSASTDSLKRFFNMASGVDLTEFFNDFVGGSGNAATSVGGKGNPIYNINWNVRPGNELVLQVGSQTKTAGNNVSYFNTPVVIHATNAATGWTRDTTIVFFDWGGGNLSKAGNGVSAPTPGNLLGYNLSFTPTHIFIDDSSKTLIVRMPTSTVTKLAALPVDVISFTAKKINGSNTVNLTVTNTEPIKKVTILKSNDGVNYTVAGEMLKLNSSGAEINYLFTDILLNPASTFYKAIIYTNSKEEYTNIVKIEERINVDISVSPSPAKERVTVTFANAANEEVTIRIVSAEGKLVTEQTTKNNYIHYNVSTLSSGIYLVQVVKQGQVIASDKFLVQQ